MAELQRVDPLEARKLCADNYSNGLKYFRDGAVSHPRCTTSTLYASVAGSAAQPYEVSVAARDDGTYLARCTCPAARRQPICKHAAAVLIAWSEKPDSFVRQAEPEREEDDGKAGARLKVDSAAKRVRAPQVDRRTLIAAGLDKAEALLVDLCSQGLLAVTAAQAEMIGSLAEALEAHKLRRLARQVVEIQRAAAAAAGKRGASVADHDWTRLLCDTWFVLSATRKALDKEAEADTAELEELIGKTWLEKDLRRVADLRLLELAFQTEALSSGFRLETSYLLDLGDGALYTEKQITPLHLKGAPRKRSYALPLHVAVAGVYPGFAPPRLKLVEAEEQPGADDVWERAIALAETSAAALRQRLIQSTANLVAPQESYSLFRPASIVVDAQCLYLVDGEEKAIPISGERRAISYALRGALLRGPAGAVFCRLFFGGDAMVAQPLSVILQKGRAPERLVRLTA